MKNKLIELLKDRQQINITELPKLIPEIKGEYSMYMPVKKGFNPNILWLAGVSQDFIKVFNSLLIKEKKIEWKPSNLMVFVFDQSPIYSNISIADRKLAKTKKECWLPIAIKLKKKS